MGKIDETLAHASFGSVIGLGLALGLVHVVTAPDHLSTLMVLTTGSSWRSFQLGIRWGLGHSVGLMVITAVFLAAGQSIDLESVGKYFDLAVGVLTIALGLWAIRYYLIMRKEYLEVAVMAEIHRLEHLIVVDQQQQPQETVLVMGAPPSATIVIPSDGAGYTPPPCILETPRRPSDVVPCMPPKSPVEFDESLITRKCCFGRCNAPSSDLKDPRTTHMTAFAYGIVHGLAGTCGLLGVLPAVVLRQWGRSMTYLVAFCLSSTLIMGAFAALYGEFTGRLVAISDRLLYRIGLLSAGVTLAVGIAWVVLVATDTLDGIFH